MSKRNRKSSRKKGGNPTRSETPGKFKARVLCWLLGALAILLLLWSVVFRSTEATRPVVQQEERTAQGFKSIVHNNLTGAGESVGDPANWQELSTADAALVADAEEVLKQLLGAESEVVRHVRHSKKRVLTNAHYIRVPHATPPECPIFGLATEDTIVMSPLLFWEGQEGRHSMLLTVLVEEAFHLLDPELAKLEAGELGIKEHVALELRPKILVLRMLKELEKVKGIDPRWRRGLERTRTTILESIKAYLAEDPTLLD